MGDSELAASVATSRGRLEDNSNAYTEGRLLSFEKFWGEQQEWLELRGYRLRARYRSGWVASWLEGGKDIDSCEDAILLKNPRVLDATRISDGLPVMLKMLVLSVFPYEAEIGEFLSSPELVDDPRNHCVPIYEVLDVPGQEIKIIVMPLLQPCNEVPFSTIGEAVDFFAQIFDGLQFMHDQHIAHNDCNVNNIMMDGIALFNEPPHPVKPHMNRDYTRPSEQILTRTEEPVKYFLIDFGNSRQYDLSEGQPLEQPGYGGDQTVPEFKYKDVPCDPFRVDVYMIGNIVRRVFLKGDKYLFRAKSGFEFVERLIGDMCHEDPSQRPTMDEVVTRLAAIRRGMSTWKLRSRVADKDEFMLFGIFRSVAHWMRQLRFIVQGLPPIPRP